eukprot:1062711-Pyramimonas_sp.AAC.1
MRYPRVFDVLWPLERAPKASKTGEEAHRRASGLSCMAVVGHVGSVDSQPCSKSLGKSHAGN